jgi:hypothetical protein
MASTVELLLLAVMMGNPAPPLVSTDTGTNTAGNAATSATAISHAFTIGAFDAQPGTVYEIGIPVTGTWEGTALTLGAFFDGTTNVNIVPLIAGAFTSGHGFAGTVRVKMTCTASGTGGSVNLDMDGTLSDSSVNRGPTTSVTVNGHATHALDTTVSHTLAVSAFWASNTASQTVSGVTSKYTRSGP